MRISRSIFLAATALSGLTGICSPAFAQTAAQTTAQTTGEAAADTPNDSDAIVVTARRRAEDVSKVPIAITAFSGDTLVAKGIQNTQDLMKITPGLNIADNGSKVGPYVVLRAQSRSAVGTGSAGVITYFNEVPMALYGSIIQTFDMSNIQVVKGPQGTLFGRNALGGALLTYSKGASYEFGGYVTGEVAQHDAQRIEGAINIPLVKDKVALRVAALVSHDGGPTKTYVYGPYSVTPVLDANSQPIGANATPGSLLPAAHNVDEFAIESYRATLLVEPFDGVKNVTVGDYTRVRGIAGNLSVGMYPNGFAGSPPALYYLSGDAVTKALTPSAGLGFATAYGQIIDKLAHCGTSINCDTALMQQTVQGLNGQRVSFTTEDPWTSVAKVAGISNTTTIALGEHHQLKNIFGYRVLEIYSDTSLSGLALPVINTASANRERVTTEELQASGSFMDDTLKYTVGGFLYNEKPNGVGGYQGLEVNAFFGLSHSLATTYLHNSSKAVYGQVDYSLDKLIPGLSLTAGLRQTWDTQSACTVGSVVSPFAPQLLLTDLAASKTVLPSEAQCQAVAAQVLPDAHFKKLTYTFGANWQITPDAMIYVTHRRGYRQGGYNTPLLDPYLGGLQTYRPETLTDWEVGAKVKWRAGGMRGSFEIAAFSGRDTDYQLPISTDNLSGASAPCVVEALGSPGHTTSNCTVTAQQVAGGYANAAGTAYALGTPGSLVGINGQVTYDNAASLLIRGIEASANVSPIEGVNIGGSLAYVDVTPSSPTLDPQLLAVMTAAGRGIPGIVPQGQPTWTASANLGLEYPGKVLGGDLSFSADYHYNSKYRQVQVDIPASQQVDIRLTLADIGGTNVTAAAYVRNLFDTQTWVGGAATSPSGIGAQGLNPGGVRTVGLALTYKFGAQ